MMRLFLKNPNIGKGHNVSLLLCTYYIIDVFAIYIPKTQNYCEKVVFLASVLQISQWLICKTPIIYQNGYRTRCRMTLWISDTS